MEYFDYIIDDFIPCECCKTRANDIHHLEARGSGFNERKGVNDWKNKISNLIALCRDCHILAENDKEFNNKLKLIHESNVKYNKIH